MNANRYLTPILAHIKTETIAIALRMHVFDILDAPRDREDIVSRLETDPDNTAFLLDGLVMLDLLKRENNTYRNSPFSSRFFVRESEYYFGDAYINNKEMLDAASSQLHGLIDEGHTVDNVHNQEMWKAASAKHFFQEQKGLLADAVADVVSGLEGFAQCKTMLDLGCSAGILGLEIAKRKPDLELVLFDYEGVIEFVKDHISLYGMEARARTLSGDMEQDSIGEGYDLIWCRNVFYFLKDRDAMLRKLYDALNPGGMLVSAHIEIGEDADRYEDAFFYFLVPLMQGHSVLRPNELETAFARTGFVLEKRFDAPVSVMTPITFHVVRKP